MRDKLINKLPILLLAAIFLLSMALYSTDQDATAQGKGKGGKGKKPPELYKVTISINGSGPGIENLDMEGNPVCGSVGYFYAEKMRGNFLLGIDSEGSATPGPDDDPYGGDLNMWVTPGKDIDPDKVELCSFSDGCYGETERSPGWLRITILKSYDGEGPEEDIQMRWVFDFTKVKSDKKKVRGREWHLYSLPYYEGTYLDQYVISTNPYPPEGLSVGGDSWETDVIGPFVLHHAGKACVGEEDMYNREVLPGFDIHLTIERVR